MRKAYPIATIAEKRVVNDTLDGRPIVLITAQEIDTLGVGRGIGGVQYYSGGEVQAFERAEHAFTPGPDAGTILDASGAAWQVTEGALVVPDGERVERISDHLAFWFGWHAFFPETELHGQD